MVLQKVLLIGVDVTYWDIQNILWSIPAILASIYMLSMIKHTRDPFTIASIVFTSLIMFSLAVVNYIFLW